MRNPSPSVMRILEITGLLDVFDVGRRRPAHSMGATRTLMTPAGRPPQCPKCGGLRVDEYTHYRMSRRGRRPTIDIGSA